MVVPGLGQVFVGADAAVAAAIVTAPAAVGHGSDRALAVVPAQAGGANSWKVSWFQGVGVIQEFLILVKSVCWPDGSSLHL